MKKINFDFRLANLDGKVDESSDTVAKVLANILAVKADGIQPAKAISLAVQLHNTGEVLVDKADSDAIERWVEKEDRFTNLLIVRVCETIREAWREPKQDPKNITKKGKE